MFYFPLGIPEIKHCFGKRGDQVVEERKRR
jgi:hypothetical protein